MEDGAGERSFDTPFCNLSWLTMLALASGCIRWVIIPLRQPYLGSAFFGHLISSLYGHTGTAQAGLKPLLRLFGESVWCKNEKGSNFISAQ